MMCRETYTTEIRAVKFTAQKCVMIHGAMARKYQLKKRAERQDQTRRQIVEAAIDLHTTVGPARTSVSAIAERAGVQRHTYYRHFPDDRSLFMACSGLYESRNPLPDPEPWRAIRDHDARLRRGLDELYAYYERNESMLSNVMRDAEVHPLTAEAMAVTFGPGIGEIRTVLSAGRRSKRALALLDVAIAFSTWRTLVLEGGLARGEAVKAMVAAVGCGSSV
jgi:AcrR family transcriptional regulator